MALKNPYTQYRQTQVNTASPAELIMMLYNAGIQSLKKAKLALADRNMESVHNELVKSQNIVLELQLSLNEDAGPIAEQLNALYDYMHHRLVEANLHKNAEIMDEMIDMFEQFRSMWMQVMKEAK